MGRLSIKAVPNASRNRVAGWVGDALKVHVNVPPERGRANLAVTEVIAGVLGMARERVRLVAGHTGERKVVEVDGVDDNELRGLIERHLSERESAGSRRRSAE